MILQTAAAAGAGGSSFFSFFRRPASGAGPVSGSISAVSASPVPAAPGAPPMMPMPMGKPISVAEMEKARQKVQLRGPVKQVGCCGCFVLQLKIFSQHNRSEWTPTWSAFSSPHFHRRQTNSFLVCFRAFRCLFRVCVLVVHRKLCRRSCVLPTVQGRIQ